ncbi:hypothetical protein CK203_029278 [Vitis vinifera]|uniref:Reverse transcriptase Ty1/copia-type domain-containing protein n=1 Tax=Vitis vinifera TaxID=29760 RepID=A0A438ISR1_VITVI|nr:hypothetical protein CK203_029278 [Vitis vinifera]
MMMPKSTISSPESQLLKQGNCSITEYSNILHNLWQELDHYQCIEMKCSEDATILKKFMEKDRIYTFLAGLNAEFDIVRVQVLGKEDLPSLNETIGIIQGEESRRRVMLEPQQVESSAMVLRGTNARSGGADHQPSTYCSGVTNESSWSEVKDWTQRSSGHGNMIGLARGRNGLYYLEFDGQSSKKKNGHLPAITRALLFQKNAPKNYWGEVLTTAHFINILPSQVLDHKTPTQVLESEPNLSADDRTKGIEIISNSEAYERDVFDPKPRDDYDLPIAIRKVAKMKSVRILLSLTISRGWSMQQYDVKNTFLHGDLDEEIYMEVPLVMKALKYKQGQGDHTLFVKHSASREVTALLVYVDDVVVTGDDLKGREALRKCLVQEFEIKELNRLKYFLALKLLTPDMGFLNLNKIGVVSQYLKGTLGKGILFKKGEKLTLEAYTDVDYARSIDNRRST